MSAQVASSGNSFVSEAIPESNSADKEWINVQMKTFTNWVNTQLNKKKHPLISDLERDFSTGVPLLRLLEILSGAKFPKYNTNPRMRIQKVENVNMALSHIRKCGASLTNIGGEDIVDGNLKLILGLLWIMILKFSISDISEEGCEAKEALLLWCQRKTRPYENDFVIKDFSKSWKSGLELLDYDSLDKTKCRENTDLAFNVAEKELGIAKLLEARDITDVEKPDERSVITYLAQYFLEFTGEERKKKATQKVSKLVRDLNDCYNLSHDYEKRFEKLSDEINEKKESWNNCRNVNYNSVIGLLKELETFRKTEKKEWATGRRSLVMLLGTIQVRRRTYGLAPYCPPHGYHTKDLIVLWADLIKQENLTHNKCVENILKYRATFRENFKRLYEYLSSEIDGMSFKIDSIAEDYPILEDQLLAVVDFLKFLESLYEKVDDLEKSESDCINTNAYDEFTRPPDNSERVKYEFETLINHAREKLDIIQMQIEAKKTHGISDICIVKLTETFYLADKDKDKKLSKDELNMALKIEGYEIDDAAITTIYDETFNKEPVSYDSFIKFMNQEGSISSKEQLLEAFKAIAGDNDHVTKETLLENGLSQSIVDDLCKVIPADEDGNLEIESFIESLCNNSPTIAEPV